MNTRLVLKLNGYILLFDVFAMILPLIVAGVYGESAGMAFLPVMALCLAAALPLSDKGKDQKDRGDDRAV